MIRKSIRLESGLVRPLTNSFQLDQQDHLITNYERADKSAL
jgi:hypothetical protein